MTASRNSDTVARYRVLSLAGGGARGIFQARFLERLEATLEPPLRDHFDLIAATSTGAIIGLGVAAGIPCSRIADLYKLHATAVFKPRLFASLRRGPRYNVDRLTRLLAAEFRDLTLGQLDIDVFVPTSVVDTQEGRFFTRTDSAVRLVDAILASSSAPTYFAPHTLPNDNRGYSDGGLWANDPAFAAIAHSLSVRQIDPSTIALVSVGTGRAQRGEPADALASLRPLSPATIRFIFELLGSLQVWQAQQLVRTFLKQHQVIEINPILPKWIPLDHGREALRRLPALADAQADQHSTRVRTLLSTATQAEGTQPRVVLTPHPIAAQGIATANMLKFIPARKYYSIFRGGGITDFITTAVDELVMVSVNLMTGDPFERILDTFEDMLNREAPPRITLSLLDPTEDPLMRAIAGNLEFTPRELATSIGTLIEKVETFASARLRTPLRKRLAVHCHKTLPSASAIMIDPHQTWGSIQLETRSYRARTIDAFGFEIGYGSELFETLRKSYLQLIADGRKVI